jgi:hypothetical protein
MANCREVLMSILEEGDEKYYSKQCEAFNHIQFLDGNLASINTQAKNGKLVYTDDEMATLRDKRIALLNLMFENGDFGFYHTRLFDCHKEQATYYAKKQIAEKTLYHLNSAANHAIEFLTMGIKEHTSLIFKGLSIGSFSINNKNNYALILCEETKKSDYDFLRENEEFISIIGKAEKYAGKWQV